MAGTLLPAQAAERDICENKAGAELIRCIEAAARGAEQPARPASKGTAPAAKPAAVDAPVAPPKDCTGLATDAMRRCLAAGGRLAPQEAITEPSRQTRAAPERKETCDGESGEALRRCIEAQAKADSRTISGKTQPKIIPCTGYTRADQPLCLHRNTAIVACRNRSLYPDLDVCLRSHMASAPEPARADCSAVAAQARSHCEARNRVYATCSSDKLDYFACLERRLGADAVLTRR